MKSVKSKKKYRSFLLRLWVDETNGKQDWRISLENPSTRERRGFATLKDLLKYLELLIQEEDDNEITEPARKGG
jgi:hypothetical protein